MKTATRCLVLLVCMAAWTSAAVILKCRCMKTSPTVKESLIANINVSDPTSYCKKKQVIVLLKSNRSVCLDPDAPFTINLLNKRANEQSSKSTMAPATEPTMEPTTASASAAVQPV